MVKGSKELSTSTPDFAKGGTTPMYSVRYPKSGSKDDAGRKGSGHGVQSAGPQKPGCSAHDTSGDGGSNAKGGKGKDQKMFGYKPSVPATPGISSAR
jgi:hypothetical protein